MQMQLTPGSVKDHYDTFLAGHYLWMAGGFEANAGRNRDFFTTHNIRPSRTGRAVDLGAGCGFVTIPLAEAGFRVIAVDFCRPLLDELRGHVHSPVEIIAGDMMDFPAWAGRRPEVITCMGDTLTHLPDAGAVRNLLRQCNRELVQGGRFVLSLRDYSGEPEGNVAIIPVRRDADRIFLCRLEYSADAVVVTDILFSRISGTWERSASGYAKLRLAPARVSEMMDEAGFRINFLSAENGMIIFLGVKSD